MNNTLYFGKNSGNNHELQDNISYKACKDLKAVYKAGGYELGFHDTDYFYYEIKSRERYSIGDNIYFKQKDVYVSDYEACKYQDEIIYKYKLRRKNGVWQTKIYNSLLCGASLEGKVLAVEGEEVKLHLNIDENQAEGEGSLFKYAPPTGNTMYSMPVVGTSAKLYFPDESGNEPLVSGCVRSNGSSCAKTSDTTKRYFGTEHGSELEMTPSALNIKGGSASPISISIDDSVGIKITSPKKLTLSADSEIIMKTPKNVKINGVSQISALKSNTQSGFSLETDLHFLSDNIIKNGSSSEPYPDFEDEPQAGKIPEPEPPKEEKKGFNWGKLIKYGLGAVVVAASVLTFGLGATIAIIAVSAVAVAAGAGASKAGQSNINSQLEKNGGDQSKIDYGEVLKAEFKGALTGAKDMIFTEGCVAGDVAMQTSTFVVDVLSFGTFHDRAEKASQWWHGFFKEKAPYKDSYEYLEYLTNIALMVDGAKSFDKMIKGIEKTGGGFSFSIANGGDLAVAGSTYSISVSAGEIGSMAVGGGAFYNVVTNKGGTEGEGTTKGNKTYRQRIDEALSNGDAKAADDIRYERYCNNKKNEGINPECREEWDKLNERIKNNRSLGYKNEPIGRESLRDYLGKNENELINNNNSGNMYTNTMDGKTVRPDSIGVNNEGNIEIVHDHKHFTSKNDQEIFNDAQMRAERDMIEAPNGKHIVTMSSDFPDLNGIPPKPRPSGPLAERSDIYYTDTSCGKITHKWDSSSESWVKLIDFRRDY